MKTLCAAVALALLLMPIHAEAKGKRQQSDQASAQKKPDDSAYKKALGSIPNQKAADPWAGMR